MGAAPAIAEGRRERVAFVVRLGIRAGLVRVAAVGARLALWLVFDAHLDGQGHRLAYVAGMVACDRDELVAALREHDGVEGERRRIEHGRLVGAIDAQPHLGDAGIRVADLDRDRHLDRARVVDEIRIGRDPVDERWCIVACAAHRRLDEVARRTAVRPGVAELAGRRREAAACGPRHERIAVVARRHIDARRLEPIQLVPRDLVHDAVAARRRMVAGIGMRRRCGTQDAPAPVRQLDHDGATRVAVARARATADEHQIVAALVDRLDDLRRVPLDPAAGEPCHLAVLVEDGVARTEADDHHLVADIDRIDLAAGREQHDRHVGHRLGQPAVREIDALGGRDVAGERRACCGRDRARRRIGALTECHVRRMRRGVAVSGVEHDLGMHERAGAEREIVRRHHRDRRRELTRLRLEPIDDRLRCGQWRHHRLRERGRRHQRGDRRRHATEHCIHIDLDDATRIAIARCGRTYPPSWWQRPVRPRSRGGAYDATPRDADEVVEFLPGYSTPTRVDRLALVAPRSERPPQLARA